MLNHIGTEPLRTSRLTLRRFTVADARAVFDNWASDPAVTEFLRWKPHADISVTEAVLGDWEENYRRNDYYQWAIVPDGVGEPVGDIAAVQIDDALAMVHIGYALGKRWWHQGYMSEALAGVIDFFFEKVGANRIESQHDPNNPHSGGVMRKCGMKFEGTRRQSDFSNRGIVDASMYSMLRQDWGGPNRP